MHKTPCYRCDNREIGCHINCPAYNKWKEEHNQMRETEQLESYIDLRSSGFLNTSASKRRLK